VERAIALGLEEMGFSDHAPLVHIVDPKISMSHGQLPLYHQMIEDVRSRYKNKIRIKIAVEADFIPGYEAKTKTILDGYPYDYVIGSVHFIKDWGFDNPDERDGWNEHNVNAVYHDYFDLLRQSAKAGIFDIMGHVDLVKKFGNRPTQDMTQEVRQTAQVFKKAGVAVEINTSGLRKPVNEMYPQLAHLKKYCAAGVPLTFGSDAHDPKDVGADFAAAVELAKKAGYSEYVLFEKRKIVDRIKL
jgi:histidinol-phosphatase (PHP family)